MVFVSSIGNSGVSLYCDMNGILGLSIGNVFYGYFMVLWGKFYVWLCFSTINEQLIVLRALYVQLSLYISCIVDIERQYPDALAVFKRGEHLSAECCCSWCHQTYAIEYRLLIKFLSLNIDGIDPKRCANRHRSCQQECRHFCCYVRTSRQRQH